MIILGLDPGTATTGFGIISYDGYEFKLIDFGCIKTKANTPLPERITQIIEDLETILKEFQPDEVSIEEIFFNKNVKTGIQVAHARGAILHHLAKSGYQTSEYNPLQVKFNLCGYGKAEKKQVQKMVKLLLELEEMPEPDDAADALAIALCHASFIKQKTVLSY